MKSDYEDRVDDYIIKMLSCPKSVVTSLKKLKVMGEIKTAKQKRVIVANSEKALW